MTTCKVVEFHFDSIEERDKCYEFLNELSDINFNKRVLEELCYQIYDEQTGNNKIDFRIMYD